MLLFYALFKNVGDVSMFFTKLFFSVGDEHLPIGLYILLYETLLISEFYNVIF
jgi:hypothetical protein